MTCYSSHANFERPGRLQDIFAVLLALFMFGCAEPTIDAHDNEAFARSTFAAKQSLPTERKRQFDLALQTVIEHYSNETTDDLDFVALNNQIGGMSGDDLIAFGSRLKYEEEIAASNARIVAVKRTALFEQDQSKKQQFSLLRARRSGESLLSFIEIDVQNATNEIVTAFSMEVEYRVPGRAVAHAVIPVEIQIPGGLEPGETATFRQLPLGFPRVDVPGAEFFGHVVELRGVRNQLLFETELTYTDRQLVAQASDLEKRTAAIALLAEGRIERDHPLLQSGPAAHQESVLIEDVRQQMPRLEPDSQNKAKPGP
jgi:hypothetical protein